MPGIIPASKEAEEALLGLLIQYPSSITSANDQGLVVGDFYEKSNQIIFKTIMDMDAEGKTVDMASLITRLQDQGFISQVGGATNIARIMDLGYSSEKSEQFIRIIQEKSLLRQLISVTDEIRKDAMDRSYDVSSVMEKAAIAVRNITEARQRSDLKSTRDLVKGVVDYITSLDGKNSKGVLSSYSRLDWNTNGFQKGDLIILAARTSVGKTAFAVNLAANAAVKYSKVVAFFELEMSNEQIITRMLGVDGNVRLDKLRKGNLDSDDSNKLMDAEHDLANADIYTDEASVIKVSEIAGKCRKLNSELKAVGKQLDMIVIDYLQLITASKERESRQQDVSEISRGLKQMARELNCPVIALSQLSRTTVNRKDKKPILSDLRESGAIEQDADLVMFLHQEDESAEKNYNAEESRQIKLIIAKNRNGALMEDPLVFDTTTGRFLEQAGEYEGE